MQTIMLSFVLKIRDKCWFYTHQLYPNDSEISNFKDFRMRFSLYFLPPAILLIGIVAWVFSVFLNRPKNIGINNFYIILPLSVIFYIAYRYLFKKLFERLAKYPYDGRHDSGYQKNRIFCVTLILIEVIVVFVLIYFLFKIRYTIYG